MRLTGERFFLTTEDAEFSLNPDNAFKFNAEIAEVAENLLYRSFIVN